MTDDMAAKEQELREQIRSAEQQLVSLRDQNAQRKREALVGKYYRLYCRDEDLDPIVRWMYVSGLVTGYVTGLSVFVFEVDAPVVRFPGLGKAYHRTLDHHNFERATEVSRAEFMDAWNDEYIKRQNAAFVKAISGASEPPTPQELIDYDLREPDPPRDTPAEPHDPD